MIVKEGKNILLNEKKVCQKYLKFGVRIKKDLGEVINILEYCKIPLLLSNDEILLSFFSIIFTIPLWLLFFTIKHMKHWK